MKISIPTETSIKKIVRKEVSYIFKREFALFKSELRHELLLSKDPIVSDDSKIECLDFPDSLNDSLKSQGIKTVGSLAAQSPSTLLGTGVYPYIGKVALTRIRKALIQHGRRLANDV